MGLGEELLEVGEDACGGDWARKPRPLFRNVGDDNRDGGLVGDLRTLVGENLSGGENGGGVGELVADELSSAANSCSSGTGDSVGDGLLMGKRV